LIKRANPYELSHNQNLGIAHFVCRILQLKLIDIYLYEILKFQRPIGHRIALEKNKLST